MYADSITIGLMSSEIILVGMAMFIYVVGAFEPKAKVWPWIACITYLVVLVFVPTYETPLWKQVVANGVSLNSSLIIDDLGQFVRFLAVPMGLLFSLMIWQRKDGELASERLGTLMLAVVGVMLVGRANDLTLLFLGLEMVSIPTYVLLFLGRRDRATAEATVKYFFLSILSSALLLYGLSFLYGLAGTTAIVGTAQAPGIREALSGVGTTTSLENMTPMATIALVLIFAGLGFKIAAVPFHFYAPDVYQGTNNTNAGLLAVAPKIAGIVALIRLAILLPAAVGAFAWQLALIIAILTMTLGNICALWQKNVRRLLAYSSIAHSGYMLIGIAVGLAGGAGGLSGALFYVVVYAAASIGTFAALTYLESEDKPLQGTDDLAGLGQTQPLAAATIAAAMFSFSGIPIFAGFWGKFGLFMSAVNLATTSTNRTISTWFIILAIVGALNAAIAAAYYLRIVALMFFYPSRGALPAEGGKASLVATVACGLAVVALGVVWNPLMDWSKIAEQKLSQPGKVAVQIDNSDAVATR